MSKPVILTGLRANNDLTIGNYFGGILPMIDMAKTKSDEYQINMFIPDLHSFTTPIDHTRLYEQTLHNARLFVAAGLPLNNPDIHLYRQSHVSAHSELTWILNCFTGFGQMRRMTQFKDKAGLGSRDYIDPIKDINSWKETLPALDRIVEEVTKWAENDKKQDNVSVGLFNYPVLMSSDILLYGAKYVPVGDDQSQHLEFTRDISLRMNSRFGDVLIVPEPVAKQHEFFGKDQGLRIKDLVDPSKKMSKSDDSTRGVIFLGDDPELAAKKVMGATTDDLGAVHYDKAGQPGISNLLDILALLRGQAVTETTKEFEGQSSYGDFKNVVADELKTFLVNFQLRLASVGDDEVIAKLEDSEEKMRIQANEILLRVQRAVGLRPKED